MALFPAGTEQWVSLGTTGTSATRPGARESPTTRSENMSWDVLLPTLRLDPATYIQSECRRQQEVPRLEAGLKNCIVLVDSTAYQQWYESHYALPLGQKKGAKLTPEEEEILNKKTIKENSE
ncbi:hypothetical protein QTO34_016298 [Cnephaeus nilssonii]|uniref:Uncharacterized protein n=1 Tax=Cnephaeus nilssonii TaxID=3371016 RepID=A0AA40I5P1_CNENI|nr:hypothetical protein QTO34_016298 [Eptesicus nilssonii]